MKKDYNSIDTEDFARAILEETNNTELDLACYMVNYAKRLDAATDGEAEALLEITDDIGWTDEDDKNVDILELIKGKLEEDDSEDAETLSERAA